MLSAERERSPFSCFDLAHFLEFRNWDSLMCLRERLPRRPQGSSVGRAAQVDASPHSMEGSSAVRRLLFSAAGRALP